MSEKCEKLVKELKTIDKKYQDKVKTMDDRYVGQAMWKIIKKMFLKSVMEMQI
jgi:hypothetical protein